MELLPLSLVAGVAPEMRPVARILQPGDRLQVLK